ncbi:MAG TPA: hypothetical protein VGL75_02600 [Acidothermaceae bacterium]|jgi:hypothetical protein
MPPSDQDPLEPPLPPPNPFEPASPVTFAGRDPMATPLSPSSPSKGRTTRPSKPATAAASGVKASPSSSTAASNASAATTEKTSSTASTDRDARAFPALDASKFQRVFRELVGAFGNVANEKLTRDDLARDRGLWLTDSDDQADIGDPVGAIAVRHLGMAKLKNVEDLEDLVQLAAASVAYVSANVRKLFEISRERRLIRLRAHVHANPQAEEATS